MKKASLCLFVAAALLGNGCNDTFKNLSGQGSKGSLSDYNPIGNFDSRQSALNTDSSQLLNGLDLVVAIDTSGSMNEEKEAVENNIQTLLLGLQKSDLDPRIHVIAGGRDKRKRDENSDPKIVFEFPAGIEVDRAALVAKSVGSHDALGRVSALLSGELDDRYLDVYGEPMDEPLSFRDDAQLEVLIVSDDDGSNDSARDDDFGNLAEDFDPENIWNATVSGIIGVPDSSESTGSCEIARVGEEYISLAKRTGGTVLDICSDNWSDLLQRFSNDIKKRSASLLLSKKPLSADRILVTIDGRTLGPDAWNFNAMENRVYLLPSSGFKAGMVLQAKYVYNL